MNLKKRIFYISVFLALGYYILDAIIGAIAYKEQNFLEVLITAVPYQLLYSRLIAVGSIIVLAILVNNLLDKRQVAQTKSTEPHKLSADPMLMVNMSNHIRTPLNAIQGFVELLDDSSLSENSRTIYINHIRTSSKYLLELVNNVTDITLIESGALYLDESECKLNSVLSEIQKRYAVIADEKETNDLKVVLQTNIRDKNFAIKTDQTRLSQIIENLLENAIAFTDSGSIAFGYHTRSRDMIEFFVKDTGAGFSNDRLEMLLGKSGKIVNRKMAPFDLASLRIKIVMHLVKLLGGELKVTSAVNKGSDFRFTIPMKIHTLDAAEIPGGEMNEYGHSDLKKDESVEKWSGKTILIAEDVESNFIYLSEILKETGATLLWAENGKDAYELAIKNPDIDLVLMDILMPEMDGYEATVKIKKERPDLPIFAQTAYHLDENDYEDARQYFSKVLIKPIWSHDLMAAIKKQFES